MKIVVAVHHFPPRYVAGGEKEAHRVAKGLLERGHEVSVICVENIQSGPETGVAWEDTVFDGIPVRRLSFRLDAAPDPWRWSYDNPWVGEHLKQYLAELQPNIFFQVSGYLMTASALAAAQSLEILTAVELTDFWFLCPRITMQRSDGTLSALPIDPAVCARCLAEEQRRYRWLGKLIPGIMMRYWQAQGSRISQIEERSRLLSMALDHTDVIVSPSQFVRSMYAHSGVPEDKIAFIRQGLESSPPQARNASAIPQTPLRFGYIGQIAPHKGLHLLIEAIRALPQRDLNLSIFGDESAFPDYSARIHHLAGGDARIRMAGVFRGQEEMARAFSDLDVIVVPSLWYENSPTVILEAFAHRIPVIATNLGGMAELVDHEINGLLFRLGDVNDLARQIQRLLEEPDLLPRLQDGIGPVKTVSQQIDEFEELFMRALTEKRRQKVAA